jgi:type II secretory pathway predicted ATPase ExeA
MVLKFYNLKEQPFGVTPDPRYLFLTPTHREALASLLYGVMSGRGFVGLIAKPGMGKTTLLFQLLQNLKNSARTVFLFQTLCTPRDFMQSLLADLGVETNDTDIVNLHAKLNELLVRETRSGKRFVVVVDEAQNLDNSVLEVVRMLSNFETPSEKLMQIVLAGQPQLADRLASPALVQLRQRISILARLKTLNRAEVVQYVDHRLGVAGYDFSAALFTNRALDLIAARSEGIPRNINNICFNALSLACGSKQRTIDRDVIQEVLNDLDLRTSQEEPTPTPAERQASKLAPKHTSMAPNLGGASVAETKMDRAGTLLRLGIAAAILLSLAWPVMRAYRRASSTTPFSSNTTFEAAKAPVIAATAVSPMVAEAPATVPVQLSETRSDATRSPLESMPVGSSQEVKARPDSRSIRVNPDETLYRISVDNYGKYNRSIVARIQELNPKVKNPDLIRSGESLRIPKNFQSSEIEQSAPDRAPNGQGDKVEKP